MALRLDKVLDIPEEYREKAEIILKRAGEEFPDSLTWELVIETLYLWENASSTTYVTSKEVFEGDLKAGVVFCIASSDWAGMSEACVGVIHSRRFNITRLIAFVIDNSEGKKSENVGLIILYIKPENEDLRRALFEEKDSITRTLNFASWGNTGTTSLVASESGKVEMMAKVVESLEERLKDRDDVRKKITVPEGEIAKFFASRSTEYLRERTTKQIGEQILLNYQIVNRVRETQKGDVVIENMTTNREELTCITAAAYQQNITLDDILLRVDHSVPKAKRKFDKTFITRDGIKVIRLEISSEDDHFFIGDDLERLKRNLMRAVSKYPSENYMNFKNFLAGSQEHYSRAVIPILLREYGDSGISQIYMSQVFSDEFSVHFKIVIVNSMACMTKEFEISFVEEIEKIPGFFVLNFIPTKTYGDICVFMFDLQCDLDVFVSEEEAYNRLVQYLGDVFESYRDFNEGMQKVYISKLFEVKEILKEYDQRLVSDIYFSMEGFHRYETPAETLSLEIKAGLDALNKAKNSISKKGNIIVELDSTGKKSMKTVIAAIAMKDKEMLMNCLGILLRKHDINLCKINSEPYFLVVMNISVKNGVFSEDDKMLIEQFCA